VTAKTPGDGGDPRLAAARRSLTNAVTWRRIQRWLARDAADQRLQARVWRLAWLFLALCIIGAVVYLVRLR